MCESPTPLVSVEPEAERPPPWPDPAASPSPGSARTLPRAHEFFNGERARPRAKIVDPQRERFFAASPTPPAPPFRDKIVTAPVTIVQRRLKRPRPPQGPNARPHVNVNVHDNERDGSEFEAPPRHLHTASPHLQPRAPARPTTMDELRAQAADGSLPRFGIERCRALHDSGEYRRAPPPRAPSPSAEDREPTRKHRLFADMDDHTRSVLDRDFENFELYLTPAEVACFRSGHRLSPAQLESMTEDMSAEESENKGIRLSYEAAPHVSLDDITNLRRASSSHSEQTTVRVKCFLMELWFFADPLWLELAADAHQHGINMAYNGETKSAKARNMPMSDELRRRLIN
jgi:hypothetical protein